MTIPDPAGRGQLARVYGVVNQGRGSERPADSDIRSALERLLSSDSFSRSERARSLLSYLVETELSGGADRLKGFSIGQDVFGKDDDFDPSTDAVVRVQAGRLRELLAAFYEGEGRGDPVEIRVPKGAYVPTYHQRAPGNAGPAPAPAARELTELDFGFRGKGLTLEPAMAVAGAQAGPARPGDGLDVPGDPGLTDYVVRNVRLFWLALGTIMALLALILVVVLLPDQEPPRLVATTPGSLPTLAVRTSGPQAGTLEPVASGMRAAIGQFPTVALLAPTGAASPAADYVLSIERSSDGGIGVDLIHSASNSLIWRRSEPDAVAAEDFAGSFTDLLTASGVLYADGFGRNGLGGLARCLHRTNRFFLRQDAERFRDAYGCFEVLPEIDRNHPLAVADLASLVNESVNDNYGYPPDASLDKALELARLAVERGPAYASAHRALGTILAATGERQAAVSAMREAVRLSPLDQNMAAALGYALFENGEYSESAAVLREATSEMRLHPRWWDYTLVLSAFMIGRTDWMAEAAEGLAGETRSYYVAARIIAADAAGDTALRDQLIDELGRSSTGLAKDPAAYYARRFPGELGEKMTEALARAGYSR